MTNSVVSANQSAGSASLSRADDARPGLMVASNTITPYRVNLHCLIAAGIPELKLHTVTTHGIGDFNWELNVPADIHPVNVSIPGEHSLDNPLRRPLNELRKGAALIDYVQKNDVRAVVFNGYRYLSYLRLMNYCHRNDIPVFLRSDSNIRSETVLSSIQRIVKRRIYRWMMKRITAIFSMGEFGDQFFSKYGADGKRFYRVPYWPDYDLFARVDDFALNRFRQKHRLSQRRRYLMYSGRMIGTKRVDLIIDAFAATARERPEWDLLICGDGPLRDQLHARVPESLLQRVVWTGFLDRDDLILAYHSAEVLAVPSAKEPWGLVVQEAMAAGMVVVASDVVGAAHEIISDGASGRIFPSGNCVALRDALLEVTEPARLAEYKHASATALERYRCEVDPVAEIRRALADAGVIDRTIAT